jgi:Tol biopolymer transport system component
LYWSPNDQTLGYLSSILSGQSMLLQSITVSGSEKTVIDTGSPYYWSWSPDGSSMIVHTGNQTTSVPVHLSFLQMGSDVIEDQLDTVPASFQAPAWSPDGEHILLSRVNDQQENEIILTDAHGKFEKAIGTYQLATAFAWSYDSELVAYIDSETQMNAGTLGKLHVLDLNNSEDFFQDDNVAAVFWSPNSKKLAYFKPLFLDPNTGEAATAETASPVLVLELHILDVNSAESKQVFKFPPTPQFSRILPYFDQYHQSATIWSPDSNNLVVSMVTQDGTPSIAIVPASGQMEARLLDTGFIAFWSWK